METDATCDNYVHGRCFSAFRNIQGECSLCDSCLTSLEKLPSVRSIRCDFRGLPAAYWEKLHVMFQTRPGISTKADAPTEEPADVSPGTPPDELFKPLDSTLDFIVKFLEGAHTKSARITPDTHSTVLRFVKAAMEWKQTPRSSQEVENYTNKLNDLMAAIVKQL